MTGAEMRILFLDAGGCKKAIVRRYTDDEIEITTPLTLFMKKRVEEMRTDSRKNEAHRQLRQDWKGQRFQSRTTR